MLLVGFKLEDTNDANYLIERTNLRMKTSDAEFMVANKSESLYGEEETHYIVTKDQRSLCYSSKKETAMV
ncbi:hypothetical protein J2Z23_003071 [Lederbergia galactosidilyticus]|nr:hypothetical protein [Lederbergia galactosidilytica]